MRKSGESVDGSCRDDVSTGESTTTGREIRREPTKHPLAEGKWDEASLLYKRK